MGKEIEAVVGVARHATKHFARAVDEEIYVLHSRECLDHLATYTSNLNDCEVARRTREHVEASLLRRLQDNPTAVQIDERGRLERCH
jgi:hypothetical protein